MKNLEQLEKTANGRISRASGAACLSLPQGDATALSSVRDEPTHDRLDSWKEIASYLGRQVRTVQRWEKQEYLPVHRHYHERIGSIYAFKNEIDIWRKSRSCRSTDSVCQGSASTAPFGNPASMIFPGKLVQNDAGRALPALENLSKSLAGADFVTAVLYFAPEAISLPAQAHVAWHQIVSPVRVPARNGRTMRTRAVHGANGKL